MQCRWLSVWSVNFVKVNTLSCQNYFFQRLWGLYIKLVEIPEGGVGGYFYIHRNSGEEGDLHEIPSLVGACGYFLEIHI